MFTFVNDDVSEFPTTIRFNEAKRGDFSYPCSLGIFKTKGAKEPKFNSLESRVGTFESWPKKDIQSPEKLADAGFYYVGENDDTKCFFCNVGIKNWKTNHDPWKEHARWSRNCFFVSINKGNEFYKNPLYEEPESATLKVSMPEPKKACLSPLLFESNVFSFQSHMLPNLKLCVVCRKYNRSIVLVPCGHFVSCDLCTISLKNCPLCQKKFRGVVKASLE